MSTLDLSEQFDQSDLTNAEVFFFGTAVVRFMAATARLGHASPGSTLDYTTQLESTGDIFALIARDFVAWTSGRMHLVPEGCEDRIRAWVSSVAGATLIEEEWAS